ncbi:SRPBCC family protein [Actinopolyspora halophila]|uniref:SRPBCC family protein n=1 Tax=Actinopolyspora halophila TaxID=1850 RepID=UPI0005256CFA|nr:SRPBCC family protein [Actinopolyspora halophila]
MAVGEVRSRVRIPCSRRTVWTVATDWPGQSEWMLGTLVRVTGGDGRSPGSELVAFTGVGDLGFLDTMRIELWQPPSSCTVRHEGKLVRGTGGFAVEPTGEDETDFVWWERFELPALLLPLWLLAKPVVSWGLKRSLRDFARRCLRYARERGDR